MTTDNEDVRQPVGVPNQAGSFEGICVHAGVVRDRVQVHTGRVRLSTLDPPDRYNAARAGISLARARLRVGATATAATLAAEAVTTMTELDSPFELPRVHDVLADLADHAGDLQDAHEHRTIAERLLTGPAEA